LPATSGNAGNPTTQTQEIVPVNGGATAQQLEPSLDDYFQYWAEKIAELTAFFGPCNWQKGGWWRVSVKTLAWHVRQMQRVQAENDLRQIRNLWVTTPYQGDDKDEAAHDADQKRQALEVLRLNAMPPAAAKAYLEAQEQIERRKLEMAANGQSLITNALSSGMQVEVSEKLGIAPKAY
jgi:hypothetical protein